MRKKQIRKYELYYSRYGGGISNKYNSRAKPWMLDVRAKSIKQAYYLVANHVVCEDMERKSNGRLTPKWGAGVGITHVDQSWGPDMLKEWPFSFNISEVGNCWGK